MQRKLILHRWLLMAWFMLWGCTASFAAVYPQTTQYPQYTSQYPQFTQTTHLTTTAPAYQFRTTSAYRVGATSETFTPLADSPSGGYSPRGVIRKDGWGNMDDDDDDNPGVGVKPTVPIGNPLALLLFALLYLYYKRKQSA